LYVNIEIDTR